MLDDAWPAAATVTVASLGHSIGGYSALALCGAQPYAAAVTVECSDNADKSYCALYADQASWTAYADERVKTCIGLTSFVDPIFGAKGENGGTLKRPVLLVGADEDIFLPLEPSLREFFEHAPQPGSLLLTIHGAGHLSFTDFLHDGTLKHALLKETTNAVVAAWLDWALQGRDAAAILFEPKSLEASTYGLHASVAGVIR